MCKCRVICFVIKYTNTPVSYLFGSTRRSLQLGSMLCLQTPPPAARTRRWSPVCRRSSSSCSSSSSSAAPSCTAGRSGYSTTGTCMLRWLGVSVLSHVINHHQCECACSQQYRCTMLVVLVWQPICSLNGSKCSGFLCKVCKQSLILNKNVSCK